MTERNNTIDLLKGFGILCVMYGHTRFIPLIGEWIYTFHMPLFFMMSGCFFKDRIRIANLTKRLIIPYFFFLAVTALIPIIIAVCKGLVQSDISGYVTDAIKLNGGGYFNDNLETSRFMKTIWFLPILWIVILLYHVLNYIFHGKRLDIIITVLFGCGCILSILKKDLPFFVDTILTVLLFFHVGRRWYPYRERLNGIFKYGSYIFIAISFAVCVLFDVVVDYKYNVAPIWNHFMAILIILSLYYIFKNFHCNWLCNIGRNSIVYFGLHRPVYLIVTIALNRFVPYPYMGFLLVILSLWIITIIQKPLKKYLPIMIGINR